MRQKKVTATGDAAVAVGGDVTAPIITNPEIHIKLEGAPSFKPTEWPKVHEVGALKLGVHRSRTVSNRPPLPPYVLRDVDREVAERMKYVATHGGMALLTGDSTSGKSRTAVHGIQRCMSDHTIYAPVRGTKLAELPRFLRDSPAAPFILWLDDLEGFLGDRGLNPALLHDLEGMNVAIVATMRDDLFEMYANSRGYRASDGEIYSRQIGNRLLRTVEPIFIERIWSDREVARASKTGDERLSDAVKHSDTYGVAEYLAAGPTLMEEWQRAQRVGGHPRGAALVQASVDLARAGFSGAVDIDVLKELHGEYLGSSTLRPEPWDEAETWATEVRYGVSGLLIPGEEYEGMWRAFDYLADAVSRTTKDRSDVPDFIWREALNLCPDDDDRWLIGMHAYMAGRDEYAIAAWEPLAADGNGSAAANLAAIYTDMGDIRSASYWRQVEFQDEFHSTVLPYDPANSLYDPETGKIAIGNFRDGRRVEIELHQHNVGVRHGIIAGERGIGKSNNLSIILLGALSSSRYCLFLIDWSPEQKHFHPFTENGAAFKCSRGDLETTLEILSAVDRVIKARIENGGYVNPSTEKPGFLVAIEEAHLLFQASSQARSLCLRIIRNGGPVGVSLFITVPDASLTSFGGSEELRKEITKEESIALYMGTGDGLRMLRDAQKAQGNGGFEDPYE
ncbi:hypothetical protein [Streptomyces europaeiscabiei]|uniref:hypothetical protein n=2 Tax=Streptomyces europaeiscabiei TaxID=146819 RepID=UPI000A9923B7|nr:hypothetical protein [Streptomyces europaeiscabiei]MDX3667413.1 hypothetical protein [Streptomyces europaeiscabiei]MDX3708749.1 hypothetical protein [Streptomyces europaeiscabiei]MDX3834760.1 hypothetical protein [Streptomyces europaeiscabiei]MDX3860932.1 hypothetical protein [Streptomyces europaeiscabiei]